MICDKVQKLLVYYSENTLAPRQRLRVEHHLSRCEGCAGELQQIEKVKERIGSLKAPERDTEFWKSFNRELSRKLSSEKDSQTVRRSILRPGPGFAAAAAIAVVLAILSLILVPDIRRESDSTRQLTPHVNRAEIIDTEDLDAGFVNTYDYDEISLALAQLSAEEVEYLSSNLYLLNGEGSQATSDYLGLDGFYEPGIDDFIDELSLEECEELYEKLEEI